jgi:hypothetical protein
MVSVIDATFGGTAMVGLDLSGTRAKTVSVWYMKFLERLVLPRGCFLHGVAGLPSLRSVTFGTCDLLCSWNPREVRFESLASPDDGAPLATSTHAFAEVGCVLGRESFPFPS